jgi:hypothetical protein
LEKRICQIGRKLKENLDRRKYRLTGAFLLALVPLLCAVIRCALDGKTLLDIYLPSSAWNDELFYYKLTQSVLHFGYPQGYFGFNESHGLCLSFAAWSPLLLVFWVIWGLFFGWNLLSPILCNIVIMMIAMFVLGYLAKPGLRKGIHIALLYAIFTPVTRYVLSGMPETECFVLLLTFFSAAFYLYEADPGKKRQQAVLTGILFFLAMLLTWMRPYYILLFFTPFMLWKKRRGFKISFAGTSCLGVLTGAVYYLINHFLSAPYLTELFYTDWITAYFQKGLFGGLKYTLWKLYTSAVSIFGMISQAVAGKGLASGALYLAFWLLLLFWIFSVYREIKNWKSRTENSLDKGAGKRVGLPLVLQLQLLLCMAGFGGADLLMYRLTEGSKHTAAFILVSLCLIPFAWKPVEKLHFDRPAGSSASLENKGRRVMRNMLPLVTLLALYFLFVVKADIPYDYAIPYVTQERSSDLNLLRAQLNKEMKLTGKAPNYDNTVIWTLWDQVNGKTTETDFGAYYMIPKGFGINLCDGGFMKAQSGKLKSRYIATIPGGDIEKTCIAAGGRKIGACQTLVVYDMRP